MNRTICIALMALPVYLYNADLGNAWSSDVPTIQNQFPIITAPMSYSTNLQSHILSGQISARDDQTEDCLRAGICRD
ncbi:hypothetical protein [Nostoc sp.]|uniref:hypothetical protein n=1 Tax=Nostoc sp. TaxID=1180 RepID=UPI0035930141